MGESGKTGSAAGCVAIVLLWIVLGLHFFSDHIWEEEPAFLKWVVIGFGCLVLLGLLGSLVFGKRDEKIYALVVLAVVALGVVFLRGRSDRKTEAAVETLLKDLSEQETALKRETDALPVINDKLTRAELNEKLTKVIEELGQQSEESRELSRRAQELIGRASAEGRAKLREGLERFTAQARQSSEQRDAWIQQVREKVKGMPKEKADREPQ